MPADLACPFPGMDPFFEGPLWKDFHDSFVPALRQALMRVLPDRYAAVIERRVTLVSEPDDRLAVYDDAVLLKAGDGGRGAAAGSGTLTAEAARTGVTFSALPRLEEDEEIYVEVIEIDDRRTVTAVEVLSPSNKRGDGRGEYLQKRNETARSPVHLVEIDLLRGDRPLPTARPLPSTDYRVLVSRADERPALRVTSWNLPDPLPVIDVPLSAGDGTVPLELGPLFDDFYRVNQYRRILDYAAEVEPELPPDQAAWVADRLAAAGLP